LYQQARFSHADMLFLLGLNLVDAPSQKTLHTLSLKRQE